MMASKLKTSNKKERVNTNLLVLIIHIDFSLISKITYQFSSIAFDVQKYV